jgi:hypothetical protein
VYNDDDIYNAIVKVCGEGYDKSGYYEAVHDLLRLSKDDDEDADKWIVLVEHKDNHGKRFDFPNEDEARSEYHRLVESEKSEPRYSRIELDHFDEFGTQDTVECWQADSDDDEDDEESA